MRCWACGVEPLETHDVSGLDDPGPVYVPGRWPAAEDGHEHAPRPPSAAELAEAGGRALARIRSEAIEGTTWG